MSKRHFLSVCDNIFNSYSPKAKLILLNNHRDEVERIITVLTEPEMNNCLSIYTRSDLNKTKKETMKKTISLIHG